MRILRTPIPGLLLCALLLLWKPWNPTWQAVWVERWGVLALFMGLELIWRLKIKSKIVQITLSYFLALGLASVALSGFHEGFDKNMIMLLRPAAQDQIIALFSFLLFLLLRIDLKIPLLLSGWVMLIAMPWMGHPSIEVPLLGNPSMAATFVVIATECHPLSLIAVILGHSWIALWVLCAATIWRFFSEQICRHWMSFSLVGISVIGLAIAFQSQIPQRGRFDIWKEIWDLWLTAGWRKMIFGMGEGSSRVLLPLLDLIRTAGPYPHVSVWVHNDWLQELIEIGMVGFGLCLASAFHIFRLASQKDRGLLIAYGLAMVANFPLHWAISAMIGWALVSRILLADGIIDKKRELTSS